MIPANIVDALAAQNLHLRCFLYELATKRFSDVMWAMQQILFKGLDRRLAEFLLAEAARTGSDTIRMTHTPVSYTHLDVYKRQLLGLHDRVSHVIA